MKTTVFHEDIFYTHFQPYRHPSTQFDIWGGMGLETFGSDLQVARSSDVNFVWTVLDCAEGPDQWISPGLHLVNRVCYLLSSIPHNDAPILFRTEGRPRPITTMGMIRRLTTLRRIMDQHIVSRS